MSVLPSYTGDIAFTIFDMAANYRNPDDAESFEHFKKLWEQGNGPEHFLSLVSTELVSSESTRLVMDQFNSSQIASRVEAQMLLEMIWIIWCHLSPGPVSTWNAFYLNDYTLYDLLWITLFDFYLSRWRPHTDGMSGLSWGLCENCKVQSVSLH